MLQCLFYFLFYFLQTKGTILFLQSKESDYSNGSERKMFRIYLIKNYKMYSSDSKCRFFCIIP